MITLAAVLAWPAMAAAQTSTPTPTPPPKPKPKPVSGKLKLTIQHTFRDQGRNVELTRNAWRVTGRMRPYVRGQKVWVRFMRGSKVLHQQAERLRSIKHGRVGRFRASYRAKYPGTISVTAVHFKTAKMKTVHSSNRPRVLILRPDVHASATVVRLLQKGLARLRYVNSRSGVYDNSTARAVMAYRKVAGMARTFSASEAVVRRVLARRGAFRIRYPSHGHHVEADLSKQVLVLIDHGKVQRIYHMSSGKPSTPTVLGSFHVYRKSPGTNSHGMVHSSYFIGGYAIHGYVDVPPYAASHGCLRVPIPNAWSIYTWVHMGDIVDVYP